MAADQYFQYPNTTITGAVIVIGTVTADQGTTPWVDNVAQFGGNNVVTGTGVSGAGIPRVTVSSDSFPATQPVSGTVTANQGTSPWVENVSQFGGSNVVTGTGVSGSGIPRVTVSSDSFPATQPISGTVAATQSGTWTVQPGNTPNTSPWLATINQGGNSAVVTGAGALTVDGSAVTQPISGTVTANAGTNLNTSALALDTSVNGILVSQGSSTSGEKGPLVQGAVTTAAPTYTAGQTSPLSLTTAGALRVDTSGSAGGTVTANQGTSPWVDNISQFGGSNVVTGTGTSGAGIPRVTVSSDSFPATQPVSGTVAATQSGTWTVQPGNTANTTPWLATINQGGNSAAVTGANALKVDGSAVTQPVSGTVTANQGTSPWVNNLTQVGGSAIALGQTTMSASLPVAIASNQSAIATKAPLGGTSPSFASGSISVVTTITAPGSAVGFQLQALDTNTANMRYCLGATASSSNGMQLEPGRDSNFIPCGSNISICPESGTQGYTVQWVA